MAGSGRRQRHDALLLLPSVLVLLLLGWPSLLHAGQLGSSRSMEAAAEGAVGADGPGSGGDGAVVELPAPTCDLCADNWLFVISAGVVVGTNSLMTALNGLPGVEIAEEHWGFLHAQTTASEELVHLQEMGGASWKHHPADHANVMCSVQKSMKRILYGAEHESIVSASQVIGVREFQDPTPRMLRFMSQAFPCARYVLAHRADAANMVKWVPEQVQWEWYDSWFGSLASALPRTMVRFPVDKAGLREYNTMAHRLLGVRGCLITSVPSDTENDMNEGGRPKGPGVLLSGNCDFSRVDFRLSVRELAAQEATWERIWTQWFENAEHESTHNATKAEL